MNAHPLSIAHSNYCIGMTYEQGFWFVSSKLVLPEKLELMFSLRRLCFYPLWHQPFKTWQRKSTHLQQHNVDLVLCIKIKWPTQQFCKTLRKHLKNIFSFTATQVVHILKKWLALNTI